MTTEITFERVNAFRMDRHFLTKQAPRKDMVKVVERVCGLQAQMPAATQLQLWARTAEISPSDVTNALWESKLLLRTWCMRGTAHYIATHEFPIYLESLIKPRIPPYKEWLKKRGMREFGEITKTDPTQHDYESITQTILEALASGPLTREEVANIVTQEHGSEARPWVDTGYYRELAENTILTHYLRCYGPATPQDFASWSGLKMTTVNPIWERFKTKLAEVSLNKKSAWLLNHDLDILLKTKIGSRPLRLLPHFDVYLLGHRDKSHIVEKTYYKQVFKKAAWIAPILLADGCALGTWKQNRTTKKIKVTVNPFEKFSESHLSDIEAEARRLGNFFELASEVKIKS